MKITDVPIYERKRVGDKIVWSKDETIELTTEEQVQEKEQEREQETPIKKQVLFEPVALPEELTEFDIFVENFLTMLSFLSMFGALGLLYFDEDEQNIWYIAGCVALTAFFGICAYLKNFANKSKYYKRW